MFDPRATELITVVLFGKSVHLNRPGKKHSSGVGVSLPAVTKIKKRHFLAHFILNFNVQRDISNKCRKL